jgi:hypothetical protein
MNLVSLPCISSVLNGSQPMQAHVRSGDVTSVEVPFAGLQPGRELLLELLHPSSPLRLYATLIALVLS